MYLACVGLHGHARGLDWDPDFDPVGDQMLRAHFVAQYAGNWTARWDPLGAEAPRPFEWSIDLHASQRFDLADRNNGTRVSLSFWHARPPAIHTVIGARTTSYRLEVIERGGMPCGGIHSSPNITQRREFVPVVERDLPDHPECGPRMVALTEQHGDLAFYTCVDRPWPVFPDLTQITYLLEAGTLSWVWSPAPFAFAPAPPHPEGALPWPVPALCHPFFRRSLSQDATTAQRNLGLQIAWGEPGDLVWLQFWQDDVETGAFAMLYPDGMPQTIGYRVEGQQHGLWYYFAPDGTLVEARLYGLGALLENLPVENTAP